MFEVFHNKILERNKRSSLSVTERHQRLAFCPERLGRGWPEPAGAELCEHDSFPGVRTRDDETADGSFSYCCKS